MKKEIYLTNQLMASVKELVSDKNSGNYVRLLWAISNHGARQVLKGQDETCHFLSELRTFVHHLNHTFPVDSDDSYYLDNTPESDCR